MAVERTLAIIKPDAVKKNVAGEIIAMITQKGFKILGMKMTAITEKQAGKFYEARIDQLLPGRKTPAYAIFSKATKCTNSPLLFHTGYSSTKQL